MELRCDQRILSHLVERGIFKKEDLLWKGKCRANGRKAQDIQKTISRWMSSFSTLPHLFKSITFDRGKELSDRKTITNAHNIDIFFADPGYPSQKGLNGNANGLLHHHRLPKKTDFTGIFPLLFSPLKSVYNRFNYQIKNKVIRGILAYE
ncbi:hypothetical protein [Pelistega ratti]|uniref:hypothetical protein n=1 Tax=Pelistega ratti TaxID=2652177 RepID=UPI0019544CA7